MRSRLRLHVTRLALFGLVLIFIFAGGSAAGNGDGTAKGTVTVAELRVSRLPASTSSPAISGSPVVGNTLTASDGSWSGPVSSYAYQWLRCDSSGNACASFDGATSSSYRVVSADVGDTLRVGVTASNNNGSSVATSDATSVVTAAVTVSGPTNTSPPTISGTPTVGQTLTGSSGTWSGSPTSYAYQWKRCDSAGGSCGNISGATSTSYGVTSSDTGYTVRLAVTASNSSGSSTATSSQTAAVSAQSSSVPSNTSPPTITGTPTVGQTLAGSSGTWSGSPTSYAYQWKRCDSAGGSCGNISGATSTSYGFTSSDTGYTIRLAVTASNSSGSSTATSSQTATVTTTNGGVAVPGPIAGLGYSRVFDDEFSNLSYTNSPINNAYTWQRPYNGGNDPGTVFVDANNVLHLKYTTATATKPVLIGTRKSNGNYQGSWTYGYFEASIAIPAGIGTYPQFWLASTPQIWGSTCSTTTQWTNGSPLLNPEIDVLEGGWEQNGWGKSGIQQYNTSVHSNTSGGCGSPDQLQTHFNSSGQLDGAFHTYAVLWTPSTVTFYLDGVQTASFPTPASANSPLYLILGSDRHTATRGLCHR